MIWGSGNEQLTGEALDDDHRFLRRCVVWSRLDPVRAWLPTSPTGRAFSNDLRDIEEDPLRQHDVHGPWEHQGLTAQQTLYNRATSLLHSEFGAEGITHRRTLVHTMDKADLWPVTLDNPAWFHRGAWWVKAEQWRVAGRVDTLDKLICGRSTCRPKACVMRSRPNRRASIRTAARCRGSSMNRTDGRLHVAVTTADALPLYFAVARAYAPVLVAARFDTQTWAGRAEFEAAPWCANSTLDALEGTLRARLVGLDGTVYAAWEHPVSLAPNAVTPGPALRHALDGVADVFLLDLALNLAGAEPVARRYLFTRQPTLHAALYAPEARRASSWSRADAWHRSVQPRRADGAVRLARRRAPDAPGYARFDDNFFCLLPGEARTVTVTWQGAPRLSARSPPAVEFWRAGFARSMRDDDGG